MSTLKKISAVMLTATAISLASVGQAQAALLNVNSVTTDMGADFGPIENIINGSGMNPAGTAHAQSSATNSWLSAAGRTNGEIIFDLGNQFKLTEMKIWNINGTTSNLGIQNVSFATAQPGANPIYSDLTFSSSTPSGSNNLNVGTIAFPAFVANTFAVPNVLARYIKFTVNSGFGANRTGLSEVRFFGTPQAAIPTPALLPGLVGLGLAAARKRRAKGETIAA